MSTWSRFGDNWSVAWEARSGPVEWHLNVLVRRCHEKWIWSPMAVESHLTDLAEKPVGDKCYLARGVPEICQQTRVVAAAKKMIAADGAAFASQKV